MFKATEVERKIREIYLTIIITISNKIYVTIYK